MHLRRRLQESGTTMPELLVTALLVGTFFASIFEVNAVCLRYINASKENIAAVETVQDRMEKLRSLSFTDLISPTAMKATSPAASVILVNPPNASDFGSRVSEE